MVIGDSVPATIGDHGRVIKVPVARTENVCSASDGGSNDRIIVPVVRHYWNQILFPRLHTRAAADSRAASTRSISWSSKPMEALDSLRTNGVVRHFRKLDHVDYGSLVLTEGVTYDRLVETAFVRLEALHAARDRFHTNICARSSPSNARWLRLELGDCADHELIKQRHRERNVSMGRAVNHSFLDQPGAYWAEARDLDPQNVRNVARPVRTSSKFGHCSQEVLLAWRQAVKADPKEILVEPRNDCRRGVPNDLQCGFLIGSMLTLVLTHIFTETREPGNPTSRWL